MRVHVKSLTGHTALIEYAPGTKFIVVHTDIAERMECAWNTIKCFEAGRSLLTFATFFETLEALGFSDGATPTTVHVVLRLGGPQPQESELFAFVGTSIEEARSNEHFERELARMQHLFSVNPPSEMCPLCMEYAVVRLLSCALHAICPSCLDALVEKTCPYCRHANVTLLHPAPQQQPPPPTLVDALSVVSLGC